MMRLIIAFVGIPLAALILYGLFPLAIERAPTAIMHLWRDAAWGAALCGGEMVIILPVLFIRARLWDWRTAHSGCTKINGQYYRSDRP